MKKKLLVIDDDPVVLRYIDLLFSKEGYQVVKAEHGLVALDILKTYTPDVILVDMVMPNISGKKLCQLIRERERLKDVCLIILSATVAEEKIDLHELGADACIAKGPYEETAQHIFAVIDQQDAIPSQRFEGKILGIENVYPRRVTKELLGVKKHFERILEEISEGILELTHDGRVLYANPAALSLIPMFEGEFIGSHFAAIFGPEEQERIEKLVNAGADEPKANPEDTPIRLNGYLVTLQILPMGGDKSKTVLILRDVTDQKLFEQRIQKNEAQLAELINKNVDAIVIADREGEVQFVNPAATDLFARKRGRFVGKQFGFPLMGGTSTEIEVLSSWEDVRIADMLVTEVKWEGKKAYLASLRDITERKEMEEDLRMANRKILDQQKAVIDEERLKVLLQMAGATAHEINQPLTALLGDLDLLKLSSDNPEKQAKYISQLKIAGRKIANTVKNISHIHYYETKPYAGVTSIINIYQDLNILSVEGSDADFESIEAFLQKMGRMKLARAKDIAGALRALETAKTDLVMLEHKLPDGNGLDFMEKMHEKNIETPVIVITGYGSEIIASRLIKAGAYDYLTKDMLNLETISASITNALEKIRLKRDVGLAREKMAEMATMDQLTGLYNRRYFMEALERDMARVKRHGIGLAISMMDLDYFKGINDTYGHSAGDMVLSEIGKILKKWARQVDLVCRYGGEEFVVIMPDTGLEGGKIACERLRKMVGEHPFEYEASQFQMTISIGIAEYSGSEDQLLPDLIKRADAALYRAKNEGRNRVI
ncbi:MAG: diguanylate cyclase [Desulfobacteraceae bacterium]|nr:diguanylate cyclase [Desulfobacteraceae bacterium]